MNEYIKQYVDFGKKSGLQNIIEISPGDIQFDIRALLKCRWGCDYFEGNIRCGNRDLSYPDSMEMINNYSAILLLHSHNNHELYRTCLEIEKKAFLDGFYFAFAIKACNYCKICSVMKKGDCPHPGKIRPCDQSLGIDMYKTVTRLGLPCKVLKDKEDAANRYGLVCIK